MNWSVRCGDRRRGRSSGDLQCKRRISAAVPGIRGKAETAVPGKLIPTVPFVTSLNGRSSSPDIVSWRERLDAWAATHVAHRAHAEDRASVDELPRPRRELGLAGWTRYSLPYAAQRAVSESHAVAHSTFVRWR